MKKMLLVMAAGALFAAGTAMADTVTSVNVVGYMTVTIPDNGVALVTPVLENMAGATIGDLVGSALPEGSTAVLWDRSAKAYVYGSRTRSGWDMTNIILRGDAVWLRPKANSGPINVTFMGEVPANYNLASTTTVDNIIGTDAVGYAYPVDVYWTNTTLSSASPEGSSLVVWNVDSQGYSYYSRLRSGWDTPAQFKIKAGQGFWIRSVNPIDWQEVAPYDL